MTTSGIHEGSARRLAATLLQLEESQIDIVGGALAGGLESVAVHWVRASSPASTGRAVAFVSKHLSGRHTREAGVYTRVLGTYARGLAPALLGVELSPEGEARLYLELVERSQAWPWTSGSARLGAMTMLAELHRAPVAEVAPLLPEWDYDAELAVTAARAAVDLERATRTVELLPLRVGLPWVRRLAAAAPALRRELVASHGGPAFIHGDVHPGNLMMTRRDGAERAVLVDWGRSRVGAPLEDVSSWLQSLGYWEPAAKRQHDSLLSAYLDAAGREGGITRDLRDAYWIAAALGVLAGALSYHLWVASTASEAATAGAAVLAARDCLRMIRRADACTHG